MSAPRGLPEVLALIPARGGSKSIPRKNLLALAGRPLIAHTVERALKCARITRVIVSTDDAEIAETARRYGAETPFERPAEYAQDHSPDVDVFGHALTWLEEREGYRPELVVHLRPDRRHARVARTACRRRAFSDARAQSAEQREACSAQSHGESRNW